MKSMWGNTIWLLISFGFWLPCAGVHAQTVADDEELIGFGDIKLGAPLLRVPIQCAEPVVCQATYESLWIRVWHIDSLIQRVDVVYSGTAAKTGADLKSTPITLPQAIRAHSIRYGRTAPRLGFAGNEGGSRIVVDSANGIAYLAGAVSETSTVTEVRYLPMTDPLVEKASAVPLFRHGAWLIEASLSHPGYKNLLAHSAASARNSAINAGEITLSQIAACLPGPHCM